MGAQLSHADYAELSIDGHVGKPETGDLISARSPSTEDLIGSVPEDQVDHVDRVDRIVPERPPETVHDAFLTAEAAIGAGPDAGSSTPSPGGCGLVAHLISQLRIDKASFTGSSAAGRTIAKIGDRHNLVILGGKSATVASTMFNRSRSDRLTFQVGTDAGRQDPVRGRIPLRAVSDHTEPARRR